MLEARHLSVTYGSARAVRDVTLTVAPGEWLMLAGPNGAGKSALLSALSQSVGYQGSVFLDGKNAREWKSKTFARVVGVLSQVNHAEYAFTVGELASMGRYAHTKGFFSSADKGGRMAVERALADTGLLELRGRSMRALSGGELQRAFLAQVLAQEPRILLLDEPANHLDLMYQKQLFELIGNWMKTRGRSVISVVHDLSMALRYGTRVVLMDRGAVIADGQAEDVFASGALERAYGMDVAAWMAALSARWQEVRRAR